ncbi:cyclic nucleotide-gated ion channel 1-like [Humulus lupulus]|uniref:cyclic nucleotide-gated ion channel 1-like n=1 Tax=Humulus lupulus TaxID=3486 RepID=UPI002B4085D4|nr:cyclic nucleotide-gated ion channel 1-like [Humulus lupulus]XP_062119883.1 cyclic nucleotide-gated ion channel 1-like [Humulus lupulus]XP_062119884.1 cyclic nucleotide-gated ion channel 1-like [Humulus lupulus]XP_062119885.1 cyclic nucleotide-gated ion channel 1-like [Humulus lupulus]
MNIPGYNGSSTVRNEKQDSKAKKDGRQNHSALNPWAAYSRKWNKIFLVSCVIGVTIDPLFLYIPIVNDDQKCLNIDHNMMQIFLVLRFLTDFSYILNIIFQLQSAIATSKELGQSIFIGLPWSYLLIDILAILPLPQVVVLMYFPKITASKSLFAREFLNLLLLFQYVPRILRVYLSAKDLGRTFDSLTQRVWVRGAFFFFLYIIFGHVLGAFWYFFSIFRETACWHIACKTLGSQECKPGPFYCHGSHPIKNLTKLNEYCPVNPPNASVFNFGIFSHALESRIVCKSDFLQKFTSSFWWGLRNLSSCGQNLDTSSNVHENLFAVLISILGLLLLLYLIGNVQTYIQLATTKSEEARRNISSKQREIDLHLSHLDLPPKKRVVIKRYLSRAMKEGKEFDIEQLVSLLNVKARHNQHNTETFPGLVIKLLDVKKHEKNAAERKAKSWIQQFESLEPKIETIMEYARLRLQEGKDVDIVHLCHILPSSLEVSIKKLICLPMINKVPLLQNIDDKVLENFCSVLKPVIYSENSYIIRKGEPLDMMLFILQGVVWTFDSSTSSIERLQNGDYYGNELVEWELNTSRCSKFPVSICNLKSHTKVEAFALRAIDFEEVLLKCWCKFFQSLPNNEAMSEGMRSFAATYLQRAFRRYMNKKKSQQKKGPGQDREEIKEIIIN